MTFASQVRFNAVLFCSASLLLSACGGAADPVDAQTSAQQLAVAADPSANPAPSMAPAAAEAPSVAEAALAATPDTASVAAAVAQAAAPLAAEAAPGASGGVPATASNFELSGYEEQPQLGDAAQAPR